MKKISLVLVILIVLVFAGIFFSRFIIGGAEDTWICQNNQWVKHGNPQNPPPQTGCGTATLPVSTVSEPTQAPAGSNGSQAGLANPASAFCKEQGGESKIVTAPDGSQSGQCVFQDGRKCDEWQFFRTKACQ